MLEVRDLHAYYGKSHILHGVDFRVGEGEIVSLLGRNGVGRSTTIKAIMGEVDRTGSVVFKGRELGQFKPHQVARAGLGYVPENRDIFPQLTVRENLLLGMKSTTPGGRWRMDDMFELFPRLRERADTPGGVLSGGEQQMLTICRTLMGDPDLMMIDEPTEGLAPKMVELVADLLERIAARGVSILLVEQKLTIALRISKRLYVMGHGRIVFEGSPADLQANAAVRKEWLGADIREFGSPKAYALPNLPDRDPDRRELPQAGDRRNLRCLHGRRLRTHAGRAFPRRQAGRQDRPAGSEAGPDPRCRRYPARPAHPRCRSRAEPDGQGRPGPRFGLQGHAADR
jgi:branched-chain amino acid transport system ATP-binding protein